MLKKGKRLKKFMLMILMISLLTGCTTSNTQDTSIHRYNNSVVDVEENINKLTDENASEDEVESASFDDDIEVESDDEIDESKDEENVEKIEGEEELIFSTEAPIVSQTPTTENDENISENEETDGSEVVLDDEMVAEVEGEEEDLNENNNFSNWELSLDYANKKNEIFDYRDIVWDIDGDSTNYNDNPEKEILLQISYTKNDYTKYDVGELIIKIPNLLYQCEKSQLSTTVMLAANTSSVKNTYSWDYIGSDNPMDDEYFLFANTDEVSTAVTGSIKISYAITSLGDNMHINKDGEKVYYPEVYEKSCFEEFSSKTYATLNDCLKTDELSFSYSRTYNHLWEKQIFPIQTIVESTSIPNDIIENINDYICVKYNYSTPDNSLGFIYDKEICNSSYPYYKNLKAKIVTDFPNDCEVLDHEYNLFENNHYEQEYDFLWDGWKTSKFYPNDIYVLYPRDIYNLKNDNYLTTNNVTLYVDYEGDIDDNGESIGFVENSQKEIEINLGTMDMTWPDGDWGGIWCDLRTSVNDSWRGEDQGHSGGLKYYSEILRTSSDKQKDYAYLIPNRVLFTSAVVNKETDVYIGVDKIFATGKDNEYRLLNDNEYFIQFFRFPGTLYDAYGNKIPAKTYDIELYFRYNGEDEYTLVKTFQNTAIEPGQASPLYWEYFDRNIVGFYFKIKNVKNGIKQDWSDQNLYGYHNIIGFDFYPMKAEVADFGYIYPFCFIDVIDKNGHTYLKQSLDNYIEFSKPLLAPQDLEYMGYYLGRGCDGIPFSPISEITFQNKLGVTTELKQPNKNGEEEKFFGEATINLTKGRNVYNQYQYYLSYLSMIPDEQKIKGIECWDLLPYGMNLESSIDEIKDSIVYFPNSSWVFGYNDKTINKNDMIQILKDVCNIEVVENYNGTGRTMLHLTYDFGDNTAAFSSSESSNLDYLNLKYQYSISYDAYAENGTYTNNVYADWITNKFLLQDQVTDKGNIDPDAKDINQNGNLNDTLAHNSSTITIQDIVGSQQGLLKQVQTDKNNFRTGIAESSLDSDYKYKLRINIGESDSFVTNLVIYDNLEEAYDNNPYWQGNFVDVDTSYAQSKGYNVKVYYSENPNALSLNNEEDNWKEYTENTDKTKVKSLAFEYLDKDGNKAIIPASAMTYVIVTMHSPKETNFNMSYNNSRVEWNVIGEDGYPVPKISGLTSNTVNVVLPSSTVMMPLTGGNGNGWIYAIVIFTAFIGFMLFFIAKKCKHKKY